MLALEAVSDMIMLREEGIISHHTGTLRACFGAEGKEADKNTASCV